MPLVHSAGELAMRRINLTTTLTSTLVNIRSQDYTTTKEIRNSEETILAAFDG